MISHFLKVENVSKRFGGRQILSNIFLGCKTGQIIGLVGKNGSGKSTLLQIISGVIFADYSFVTIDDLNLVRPLQLFETISYLPQHNFIPNHLSVKGAIKLSILKEDFVEFCTDEEIEKIAPLKISQLSGGELRYLEIKLVIFRKSQFILLDEPYSGLTPIITDKVNHMIVNASSTKGIILTDHNYKNILRVATDLYYLENGAIQKLADAKDLISKGYISKNSFY